MQFTVEHPVKTDSLYSSGNIYIEVDEDDKEEIARILELSRYGVVVRESTTEEVKHVWGLEVEMDYDEPDVARDWHDEEACIILEIKDW